MEELKDKKRSVMPIKDFISYGYLQEVNRTFFHPLGLALSINYDDGENDSATLTILDCRDEEPPIIYGFKDRTAEEIVIARDKAVRVSEDMISRKNLRYKLLGFEIEGVPNYVIIK